MWGFSIEANSVQGKLFRVLLNMKSFLRAGRSEKQPSSKAWILLEARDNEESDFNPEITPFRMYWSLLEKSLKWVNDVKPENTPGYKE